MSYRGSDPQIFFNGDTKINDATLVVCSENQKKIVIEKSKIYDY